MSVTDSVPNFLARCSVLGIAQNVQDALVAAGLDTISKYAFSSAYVPGQTDERPFVDAITAALGRDATVGELAALRRLLHESYSMTAAELKQSVERQEDQGVKRLAQPERADRLAKQQARLTGLQIRGYLEPSDRLYHNMRTIDYHTLNHLHVHQRNRKYSANQRKTSTFQSLMARSASRTPSTSLRRNLEQICC